MPKVTPCSICELMHVHEDIVNRVSQEMPDEDSLFDLSELF